MYSLGYERLLTYQSEIFLIRTSGNGAFPFRCSELLSLLSSCVEEPVDYQLSCKKLGTWKYRSFPCSHKHWCWIKIIWNTWSRQTRFTRWWHPPLRTEEPSTKRSQTKSSTGFDIASSTSKKRWIIQQSVTTIVDPWTIFVRSLKQERTLLFSIEPGNGVLTSLASERIFSMSQSAKDT